MTVLGNIVISIGLLFILIGIYGNFRFKNFYSRILITSKVDTVGFITVLIGVILGQGFNVFSGKVFIILIMALITNPLATHAVAHSAYVSGYTVKREKE